MSSTSKSGRTGFASVSVYAAVLLFLAALCELITAGVVRHRLSFALNSYSYYTYAPADPKYTQFASELYYIPVQTQTKYFVYKFSEGELAAGALGVISALAIAGYTARGPRSSTQSSSGPDKLKGAVAFLLIASFVAITGIFAWVFAAEDSATAPYIDLVTPYNNPNEAYWALNGWGDTTTWERYTCEAASYVGGWFVSTCKYQRASRFTMIPLFVLSFLAWVLFLFAYPTHSRPLPGQQEYPRAVPGPRESIGGERDFVPDVEKDLEHS